MTQIVLTPQEIEDFRSQLADYPEALTALDEIADEDGDLESATEMIALKEGIGKQTKGPGESLLKALSNSYRNVICQDIKDGLLGKETVAALLAALISTGELPVALATLVAVYPVKIGLNAFCNATDDAS